MILYSLLPALLWGVVLCQNTTNTTRSPLTPPQDPIKDEIPDIVKVAFKGETTEVIDFNKAVWDQIKIITGIRDTVITHQTDVHGSWEDLVEQTSTGVFDVAAATLSVSEDRAAKILFTSAVSRGEASLAVTRSVKVDPLLFIHPFQVEVWGGMFGCMLLMAAAEFILAHPLTVQGFKDALWFTALLPFAPPNPQPKGMFFRLTVFVWKWFWFLFVAAYASSMNARLTNQRVAAGFSHINELRDASVAVPNGTYTNIWLHKHVLKEIVEISDDPVVGLNMVLNHEVKAYAADRVVIGAGLEHIPEWDRCKFYILRQDSVRPYAFAINPKRKKLRAAVSKAILQMRDNDSLLKLQTKYFPVPECPRGDEGGLTVQQTYGVFIIFGGTLPFIFIQIGLNQYRKKKGKSMLPPGAGTAPPTSKEPSAPAAAHVDKGYVLDDLQWINETLRNRKRPYSRQDPYVHPYATVPEYGQPTAAEGYEYDQGGGYTQQNVGGNRAAAYYTPLQDSPQSPAVRSRSVSPTAGGMFGYDTETQYGSHHTPTHTNTHTASMGPTITTNPSTYYTTDGTGWDTRSWDHQQQQQQQQYQPNYGYM